MSSQVEQVNETPNEIPAPLITSPEKRLRWFELCLVLLISFGEPFLSSLFTYQYGKPGASPMLSARWTMGTLREGICLVLLAYVLSRRKLNFRNLGLRWSARDIGIGILVAIVGYIVQIIGWLSMRPFFHTVAGQIHYGVSGQSLYGHPGLAAIPFFLLNPFCEELIVRAYLMTEIGELTGSWLLAVAASTIVQSSYHLYYGWEGMLSLALQFLVLSLYYAWKRKATPVIAAHEIYDLIWLIRLW